MHPAIPRGAPCIREREVPTAFGKCAVVSTSQKLRWEDTAATPETQSPVENRELAPMSVSRTVSAGYPRPPAEPLGEPGGGIN